MSSIFGKRRGNEGDEAVDATPLDLHQPRSLATAELDQAAEPAGDQAGHLPLQSSYGNASVARMLIQRKEGETSGVESATSETADVAGESPVVAAPIKVTTGTVIVEDDAETVGSGQMKKTDFLTQLRTSISKQTTEVLADTPFSGAAEAYIDRWFASYTAKTASQIEGSIRKYAPESATATSASGLAAVVTGRVQRSLVTWVATGQLSGLPGAESMSLPGAGMLGSIGGAVSGAVSATAEAAAGIGSGLGSALSAVGSLLFKEREGGAQEAGDPLAIQAQLGSGQSLDAGVRARMEAAFGEGFGDVQVHADTSAAEISENLNARAFTVGQHIAFDTGEYQPGTLVGDALIAHELAHVRQQRGAGSTGPAHKSPGEYGALEEDADNAAVGAVVSSLGGGKKGLAKIAGNALPSLKSGLRLQRCNGDKKKKPTPEPIPKDPHAEYEKWLNDGIAKLQGVRFGLAYSKPENYDTDYWFVEKDPQYGRRLTLKSDKRPSDAIDAMFGDLSKWSVDCAQFVQIAEWYALRHAFGADEFNRKAGLTFLLRVHASTLLEGTELYRRPDGSSPMTRLSDGMVEVKTVDQLLADAPVGTRITWTNLKAPTSSAFHNENTIKLGPDLFAAHGFGGGKNTFARKDIELKLAQAEDATADDAYIKTNIFLSQIRLYKTP